MPKDIKDLTPEELMVERYSNDSARQKSADAEVERRRVEKLKQQEKANKAAQDLNVK
jgi:hypothetical protein